MILEDGDLALIYLIYLLAFLSAFSVTEHVFNIYISAISLSFTNDNPFSINLDDIKDESAKLTLQPNDCIEKVL
tara:strand:+ start:117 stop:338 length:222 start_codon:yes stop_codon:yes gene_type:complete